MDGEEKTMRIRNLQGSNGQRRCLDCSKAIESGIEYYNVYQEGIWIGATHTLDGNCNNGELKSMGVKANDRCIVNDDNSADNHSYGCCS